MTVPEAMRVQALRRFRLRRRKLPVAGGTLSLVTPDSMDRLLAGQALRHYQRAGYLPYWADLWPASVGMARYLLRSGSLAGLSVMDLGCGLGLAGLAAGRQGARVVFADQDEDALAFARFNAMHNGVSEVETLRLDWFRSTAPVQVDLLLLADVAYEKAHDEPLLRHLRHCLRPGGRALLGDPYREAAGNFLELVRKDFAVEVVETDTWFEDRRLPLRLAWISRST
ncbi:MAG: methyltransferase domain-containing protein [Planctomycetes bacterium]|nr:methyltransferase domain-containing protein [Planctomycetota bacterium]